MPGCTFFWVNSLETFLRDCGSYCNHSITQLMPLFLHPNLLFHHIPMMVYWIGICWLWRPFEMLLHKWAVWLPSVWILAPMGLMIIDAFSLMNEHITAISIRPDRKSHHCKATIPLKYSFQPDFVYSLNFEWTWSSVEVIQMILSPATSSQWMIIKVLFFLMKSNVTLIVLWKCKCSLLG